MSWLSTLVAVLPAGSTLPPIEYAVVLVVGGVLVGLGVWRVRPEIDGPLILALSPWMAVGASLYVAYQLDLVPDALEPLTSSPTVYLSVAILAGAVLVVTAVALNTMRGPLATVGSVLAVTVAGAVIADAVGSGRFTPWIPLGAVIAAGLLSMFSWTAMHSVVPLATDRTGWTGALVLFAHALDGISTAFGYDLLGFGERSPLSRAIIEFSASLPTAEFVGAGWLFVVVKMILAIVAVWLIAGTMRQAREEGYLLLGFVAAVGLGPGIHNVLLFSVVRPVAGV